MEVIEVSNQTLLMGFKWSAEVKSRAEIIMEAGNDYDYLIQFRQQYGLIQTGGMKLKSPLSLAALLRDADNDHVSVYELVNVKGQTLYWVLGVHLAISARTDKVFFFRDDAMAFAESVLDTLGLENVVFYNREQSIERIAQTLADQKTVKDCRAVPISLYTKARLLKVTAAFLAVAAMAWGTSQFVGYYEQRQRLEAQSLKAAQKEAKIADVEEHPERYFQSAWMDAPTPQTFLASVVPAMMKYPLAANGWRLDSLTGTSASLTAVWEQTPFADYRELPFGGRLDSKNVKLSVSNTPLKDVMPTAHTTLADLQPQERVTALLYAFTHDFGLKNRLTFEKRESRKVEKKLVDCPWLSASWEVKSIPAYLMADYEGIGKALSIPGLTLNAVIYETDGSWTLRGELYAR